MNADAAVSPDSPPVAYLGPEGTFTHFVARQRFGENHPLTPLPSVEAVFDYLKDHPEAVGIVPIENSSGGIITATVDRILDESARIQVREEIALNVKLALLGREGDTIVRIYSHFAPFQHCERWLREHYPEARQITAPSTSNAIIFASQEPGSAAIGARESGARYGLEVLHYPLQAEVPNVTQFFIVGLEPNPVSPENHKTSLAVDLPDASGSLFSFLEPFARSGVNLKRIESRPIVGQPNKYRFFIEIQGSEADETVREALKSANAVSLRIRHLGSYPATRTFNS
ncbi:MAG: ACT domain-containing protein [Verrucomicrobiales bacterium]|nr:ACT domain-containing protein [Verrucomicrobiales bacterium]